MNEIIILFLIFGTLFLLEKKSINLLAYYVGIVIIIAIIISNLNYTVNTGIGYISYILILVQISALTILFGFIIMLFPKNNTDVLIKKKNILENKNKNINIKEITNEYKIIIYLVSILILLLIITTILPFYLKIKTIIGELDILTYINIEEIKNINIIHMENSTENIIKKISKLIYSESSNIFKFIIITIILLFAIIGLFFILLPTNL